MNSSIWTFYFTTVVCMILACEIVGVEIRAQFWGHFFPLWVPGISLGSSGFQSKHCCSLSHLAGFQISYVSKFITISNSDLDLRKKIIHFKNLFSGCVSTLCGGERSWFFVPTMLVLQIETLASLRLHSLVSFVFETGFYSVPQASLELTRVLLPQSPELLEYRPGSLGLASITAGCLPHLLLMCLKSLILPHAVSCRTIPDTPNKCQLKEVKIH